MSHVYGLEDLLRCQYNILKFICNLKGHVPKKTLKKTDKPGGLIHPDFKTYCKAILFKTVCYWLEDRPRINWNPRNKPLHNIQMTFEECANPFIGREYFQQIVLVNWIPTSKRMQLDLYLIPYTEINLNGPKIHM